MGRKEDQFEIAKRVRLLLYAYNPTEESAIRFEQDFGLTPNAAAEEFYQQSQEFIAEIEGEGGGKRKMSIEITRENANSWLAGRQVHRMRKTAITPMVRVSFPFVVHTREGPLSIGPETPDWDMGYWIAFDNEGYPYPISPEFVKNNYVERLMIDEGGDTETTDEVLRDVDESRE